MDVREVAALLRQAALDEILPRYRHVVGTLKADGSWLTEADTAMQNRVQRDLAALWPEIPFLGEEMSAEEQQVLMQQADTGLWILDPVDGTSNFSAGVPIFGPSLALIRAGEVVLGVVMDVMRDEVFSAARGEGAWLNGERMLPVVTDIPLNKTLACIDFKRLAPELAMRLVREPPYSSQRSIGSVALDWCWVAAGRFHVYLHGKQGLWDYAAGHLILQEVGGHSCTLEGEPVFNNTLDKRSAVCAGDGRLFAEWRAALA
ncbi:MAG: inositol monophosphatase family protein [Halothiobacillaceae bacterium]|nr:inositol monophosphatase family protein [Halothiobacillaceae bacterium]